MTFKGDIPEEIQIIPRGKTKVSFKWTDIDSKYNDFSINKEELVGTSCALPLPGGKGWDKEGNVSLPNTPMTGLRVAGRVYDGPNGDELKVLLPNGYFAGIEFDSFVDVLLSGGIQAGGIVSGEWIWSRSPNRMKLVRVGSGYHQALLDYKKREEKPRYEVKEMHVGKVYKTPEGSIAVFLGFINTFTMGVRCHPEDKEKAKNSWRYRRRENQDPVRYDVHFGKSKLATLWYEPRLWRTTLEKERENINRALKEKSPYRTKAIKTHKYVEELDVPKFEVPDDIIMMHRNISEKEIIDSLQRQANSEARDGNSFNYGWNRNSQSQPNVDLSHYNPTYEAAQSVKSYATKANMVPFGVEPILSTALEIFKPFLKKKDSEISKAVIAAREAKKNK